MNDKEYDLRYSAIKVLQKKIAEISSKQKENFYTIEDWNEFAKLFANKISSRLCIPFDNSETESEKIYEEQVQDIMMERIDISFCESSYIPALVYNPPAYIKKEKNPAIIISPGWPQHKGENSHSWSCRRLAQKGYIVIMIDHVCFGERSEGFYYDGNNFTGRNQTEIHIESMCTMLGIPLMGLRVWDNIRTLEYLLSRNDVDERKIGIMGICMGGIDTWLTAAIEQRIAATIVICGTTSYAAWAAELPRLSPLANAQPYIYGLSSDGDFKHIYSLIAPRPLLALNNFNDYWWPLSGFKDTTSFTKRIYELYGKEDNFSFGLRNAEHTLFAYIDECIDWLDRFLN